MYILVLMLKFYLILKYNIKLIDNKKYNKKQISKYCLIANYQS